MTMTEPVWLNGTLVPRGEARLDPLSQGFLFGAGVYDSMLLSNGVPVMAERHLDRLTPGAARFGLTVPDIATVRRSIAELSRACSLTDGRIRITLGAGPVESGDGGITLITLAPLTPLKPSVALATAHWRRNEHSPLAGIKYTACAENLLAQRAAVAGGFDEALFLNTAGDLCEAAFANVFLVRQGQVFTPALDSGCLPGVMRHTVLALCKGDDIPCAEATLAPGDAGGADELFVTSSIRGIQPVHRLDSFTFPAPGPVTQKLRLLLAHPRS